MKEEIDLQNLLERFFRNECSKREKRIVLYALRDGWIDDIFMEAIRKESENVDIPAQDEKLSARMLQDILRNMKREQVKPRRPFLRELLKVAAVIAVLILAGVGYWYIKPENHTGIASEMNTIHVPAGQTVSLTLTDGTKVWLNSRTTMRFPGTFDPGQRDIFLDGEAYFDVMHNRERPLIVHTGNYDVQVLGTSFNVEAYSESEHFVTSLMDGSVKVISVRDTSHYLVLQPNNKAVLRDGALISEPISDFNHYKWREGLISFRDMTFSELMSKFEKCYGIRIIVENRNVRDYVCTGKFRQSDGIDYALRVLQRDVKFRFQRDEEMHIIYIK